MSWSDDTRCLYCEGRLPLYRKITHGQFCSSAHRKAYWQEQERLAVERLHQTHNSLRSYRSSAHEEPVGHPELALEAGPAVRSLEAASEPLVSEVPQTVPDLLGLLAPQFLPKGGDSPGFIAADPFEYEMTGYPQPPLRVAPIEETQSSPAAHPVTGWARVSPRPWNGSPAASGSVPQDSEVSLRHPWSRPPATGIHAAGRVRLPVPEQRQAAAPKMYGNAEPFDTVLQPVTRLAWEVLPQSEELVEVLEQQAPRPDRLLALSQPLARELAPGPAWARQETLGAEPLVMLPGPAALSRQAPAYQVNAAELCALPSTMVAAQGEHARPAAVASTPLESSGVLCSAASMLGIEAANYQVGFAGLQPLPPDLVLPSPGMLANTAGVAELAPDPTAGVSSDIALPRTSAAVVSSGGPGLTALLRLPFDRKRRFGGESSRPQPVTRLFPQQVENLPILPQSSGLEPLDKKPAEDFLQPPPSVLGLLAGREALKKLGPVWAHATGFWQHAPRDLKLLLFAIPALIALVFHPGLPRVAFAAPESTGGFPSQFKRVLGDQWGSVRQTLVNRAAIALDEDFRSGLDNWVSPGDSTTEWSFDQTGFVRPGPLALYRPSVSLTDYQMQFLGLIDKKALSWVVRAADFDNFYVVKLVINKPGPLPAIGVTRYAVINGKAQDRKDVTVPISARPDMLYRVRLDVQGSNFVLEVQGQMADSWTESRLTHGGVGFFTARGEESRVRWVQITHQYDMLGRLCAYLAPYDTTNTSGSWKP